jgi:hypothetical protein
MHHTHGIIFSLPRVMENFKHQKIIPNEIGLYLLLESHYQDETSSPYSEKLDELVPGHSHLIFLKL